MGDTGKGGRKRAVGNLILPVPDTDFREFLDAVKPFAGFAPEIITAIESDLDVHAREKKSLRLLARGRKATYTRFRRQHRRGLSARRWDRPFPA